MAGPLPDSEAGMNVRPAPDCRPGGAAHPRALECCLGRGLAPVSGLVSCHKCPALSLGCRQGPRARAVQWGPRGYSTPSLREGLMRNMRLSRFYSERRPRHVAHTKITVLRGHSVPYKSAVTLRSGPVLLLAVLSGICCRPSRCNCCLCVPIK